MKTVVCFISRAHGFSILDTLINSHNYKILKIFTHSLNPKSQDPLRSQRTDFQKFVKICHKNHIPLETIDEKNQQLSGIPECDFIIEISDLICPSCIFQMSDVGIEISDFQFEISEWRFPIIHDLKYRKSKYLSG